MIRNSLFFVLLLLFAASCNESSPSLKKTTASFTLPMPPGWEVETFSIPIDFAPSIEYKGSEDIRFMPGWGVRASNEYWSYCFLWSLENKPGITAVDISKNLKAYFSGLISRNIKKNEIPRDKLFETITNFKKIETAESDEQTFQGTIKMLDYKRQEPMILNCIVHVRACAGQDITFMFHELSPRPIEDTVWKSMDALWKGFSCIADTSTK